MAKTVVRESVIDPLMVRGRWRRARTTAEMFVWIESFFAAADAGELERWAGRETRVETAGADTVA